MISLFFKQVLALVKLNIKHDLMNSRLSFILHLIFSVLVSAASLHASKLCQNMNIVSLQVVCSYAHNFCIGIIGCIAIYNSIETSMRHQQFKQRILYERLNGIKNYCITLSNIIYCSTTSFILLLPFIYTVLNSQIQQAYIHLILFFWYVLSSSLMVLTLTNLIYLFTKASNNFVSAIIIYGIVFSSAMLPLVYESQILKLFYLGLQLVKYLPNSCLVIAIMAKSNSQKYEIILNLFIISLLLIVVCLSLASFQGFKKKCKNKDTKNSQQSYQELESQRSNLFNKNQSKNRKLSQPLIYINWINQKLQNNFNQVNQVKTQLKNFKLKINSSQFISIFSSSDNHRTLSAICYHIIRNFQTNLTQNKQTFQANKNTRISFSPNSRQYGMMQFYEEIKVIDNLKYYTQIRSLQNCDKNVASSGSSTNSYIKYICELVNFPLDILANIPVKLLNQTNRRKLSLAISLINLNININQLQNKDNNNRQNIQQFHKILIIDNPTITHDQQNEQFNENTRKQIWRILQMINKQYKVTILMMTSNLQQAVSVSSRIVTLSNSKMIQNLTKQQFKNKYKPGYYITIHDLQIGNNQVSGQKVKQVQNQQEHTDIQNVIKNSMSKGLKIKQIDKLKQKYLIQVQQQEQKQQKFQIFLSFVQKLQCIENIHVQISKQNINQVYLNKQKQSNIKKTSNNNCKFNMNQSSSLIIQSQTQNVDVRQKQQIPTNPRMQNTNKLTTFKSQVKSIILIILSSIYNKNLFIYLSPFFLIIFYIILKFLLIFKLSQHYESRIDQRFYGRFDRFIIFKGSILATAAIISSWHHDKLINQTTINNVTFVRDLAVQPRYKLLYVWFSILINCIYLTIYFLIANILYKQALSPVPILILIISILHHNLFSYFISYFIKQKQAYLWYPITAIIALTASMKIVSNKYLPVLQVLQGASPAHFLWHILQRYYSKKSKLFEDQVEVKQIPSLTIGSFNFYRFQLSVSLGCLFYFAYLGQKQFGIVSRIGLFIFSIIMEWKEKLYVMIKDKKLYNKQSNKNCVISQVQNKYQGQADNLKQHKISIHQQKILQKQQQQNIKIKIGEQVAIFSQNNITNNQTRRKIMNRAAFQLIKNQSNSQEHIDEEISFSQFFNCFIQSYGYLSCWEVLMMFSSSVNERGFKLQQKLIGLFNKVQLPTYLKKTRCKDLYPHQKTKLILALCIQNGSKLQIYHDLTLNLNQTHTNPTIQKIKHQFNHQYTETKQTQNIQNLQNHTASNNNNNKTLIYSTSCLKQAEQLCSRIVMVKNDKIVYDGNTKKLMNRTIIVYNIQLMLNMDRYVQKYMIKMKMKRQQGVKIQLDQIMQVLFESVRCQVKKEVRYGNMLQLGVEVQGQRRLGYLLKLMKNQSIIQYDIQSNNKINIESY